MKRYCKFFLLILFMFVSSFFLFDDVSADDKNGWIEKDGAWYYYQNGSKVKNKCKEIYYEAASKNCYFCFDSSGIMLADTEETIGGKTYTFDSNGVRSDYYVDSDGILVDPSKAGWILIDDVWFFYKNGRPLTGLRTLDYSGGSGKFYFDEYGEMQVGFVYLEINGREIEAYFDEEIGYMVTNTVREIDGVIYRFYGDGTFEEVDGENISDDSDSDDIDYDEDDDFDDNQDNDIEDDDNRDDDFDSSDDTDDGAGDVITSGGTASGGSGGNGSSGGSGGSGSGGSGSGGSGGSTYIYSSTVKKTSCESVNNAIDFLMSLLDIIHIFVPIILILMGSVDFVKKLISFDEKNMQIATSVFIKRCLCAVIVFFIPLIVNLLFSLPGISEIDIGGVGCEIATIIVK